MGVKEEMNIIFDIADVLLDWKIEIMLEHIPDPADHDRAVKGIMEHNDWLELDRGNITQETAIDRFTERTGLSRDSITRMMASIPDSLIPNPDVIAMLDEIDREKHRLFCLSNLHLATWEGVQKLYNFWDRFEGIVISCHIGSIKPEPEIFKHLLNKFELNAQSSVFIDDRPGNIAGAKAVGLQTILFKNADDCREELQAILM